MDSLTSARPLGVVCEDLKDVERCGTSIDMCQPTWTTQSAKLWNELSNIISGRIGLDQWISFIAESPTKKECQHTFSLWLYGLNILK